MIRLREAVLPIAVASALLCGAGCDLFRPETPEPPVTRGGATVPEDYSTPLVALNTMALAMQIKTGGNGPEAWIGAFASPTRDGGATVAFDFDPAVVQELGVTPSWDLLREESFFASFCDIHSNSYRLEWLPYAPGGNDEVDDAQGTAFLPRQYRVWTQDDDGNDFQLIAIGIAELTFRKTAAERWAITLWKDRIHPEAVTTDPEQRCFSKRRLQGQ